MVKISIIMSSYNTNEEFLNLALQSIYNQSFTDYEILLVNDGGNPINLSNELMDKRLKIINFDNREGLASRMNYCIKMAKGKYVARMDTDDYLLPNRLQVQYDYMEKHNDVVVCSAFGKMFDQKSDYIYDNYSNFEDIKAQLLFTNILIHPCTMFRKDFLIKNKMFYDINYLCAQDYEFWVRIAKIGKIAIIPEILIFYRVHSNQISNNKKALQDDFIYKKMKENLNDLEIDINNIEYLKMLRFDTNLFDKKRLKKFIKNCLDNNKKKGIYSRKSLKKVLMNQYYLIMIKKYKKYWLLFRISFINYLIRKRKNEKLLNKQFSNIKGIYEGVN